MSRLGIYFGPQVITIVETKAKRPINNIQIPLAAISTGKSLEEKVPEDVKMIALIKEGLIKNKVDTKETTIVLSGKDLIIRTFEMPIMLHEELITAVNFEIKKYIPFKVEELISDFQFRFDKATRKNYVLFVGIKKETLDKYLSIIDKLGLKANSIEYAAFSVLRLFKLSRVVEKGIIAIVNIDLVQNDEINFVVTENEFPLFSRDITYIKGFQEEFVESKEIESGVSFERLKREILISLDYYDRKFPGKSTSKMFFITNPGHRSELEVFKDSGLSIHFIDITKYIGQSTAFSLAFIKAYSGSLSEINTALTINLLLAKERATKKIGAEQLKEARLIKRYKSHFKVVTASLLICIMIFIFGQYQISPLKKELKNIIGMRPQISTVSPDASYEELNDLYAKYKLKIKTLDQLIKDQLYLTELLDVIPRLAPEGIWLSNLSFKNERAQNRIELILEGIAYLADSSREIRLVNTFLSSLKESPLFIKFFNNITVVSLDNKQIEGITVTSFLISCRGFKK